MCIIKRVKNENGASILWALIFLMIFSVLGVSMLALSSQDLKEMSMQRDNLKAYYLAESGIDLIYTSLMKIPDGSDSLLIETYNDNPNKEFFGVFEFEESEIKFTPLNSGDPIPTGSNRVIVHVKIDDEHTEEDWVKITSKGVLDANNISETTSMRIKLNNYEHIIREDG